MTDEERQKLVARFRAHEIIMWTDIDLAADELERLTKELEEAKRHDMRDWHDALERGRKNPI